MKETFYSDILLLVIVALLSSAVWVGQYVQRDLWEPDEARYTYVAQEMDQTGSWFMPVRNGEPYAHKPPLMFWLIKAGTFLTEGKYNGISGRFPSLLGAALALWAFIKLASNWFDRQTAWHGALILTTSYLFWAKGGMGQIDMLLLGLEMCALYFLFSNDVERSNGRYLCAFILMGLAILAKGPVGLIVPIGIYVTANLVSGNRGNILGWHWAWGIIVALVFPAAWLLLAKLGGAPDSYFHELLFKQNFERFSGEFGGHNRPFYYYLKYLPLDFLPWTFLVPASMMVLLRQAEERNKLAALLGWIGFVALFFSLSSSKRNLYILSVYPAASLLVAAALPHLHDLSRKWQKGTILPLVGLVSLGGLSLLVVPWFIKLPVPFSIFMFPGVLMLGGGLGLLVQFRKNGLDFKWIHLCLTVFLLVEFYAGTVVLPAFNPLKTPHQLAKAAQQKITEDQPLLMYRVNGEILALYSKRRGKRVDTLQALLSNMQQTRQGLAVFRQKEWDKVDEVLATFGTVHPFKMGGKQLCWLEYDLSSHPSTILPGT